MMRTKKILIALTLIAAFAGGAQTLEFNRPEDWRYPKDCFKNGILTYCDQWRIVSSRPLIKIEPTAQYKIDAEIRRCEKSDEKLVFSGGFAVYDADKREIQPYEVTYIKGTETELAEDVKVGDAAIKLKDGSQWRQMPHVSIAFNIKDHYGDLPNRDVFLSGLKRLVRKDGCTELEFKTPLKKAYPAGTRVRQHLWSSGLYFVSTPATEDEFKKISGSISGISDGKTPYHHGKFWPGAVYFTPTVTVYPKSKSTIEIKNFKVSVKRQSDIF